MKRSKQNHEAYLWVAQKKIEKWVGFLNERKYKKSERTNEYCQPILKPTPDTSSHVTCAWRNCEFSLLNEWSGN